MEVPPEPETRSQASQQDDLCFQSFLLARVAMSLATEARHPFAGILRSASGAWG